MKAKMILTVALMAFAGVAVAQTEKQNIVSWGKKTADKITAGKFDPAYVAAPKNKWMVFASMNGEHNKYNMSLPLLDIPQYSLDNVADAKEKYPDMKDIATYKFKLHQSTRSMSVGLGYGSIRGKFSFSLGKSVNSQLHIEALGSKFGGFIDYRHSKKMKGTQYDAFYGYASRYTDPYPNPSATTQQIIDKYTKDITGDRNDYTTLHLQSHYVFNHRHFSYSAARTATRIQKKSAGSAIALVDYYQSTSKFEESLLISHNERFRTTKISAGGGYGYNYTPNGGKVLIHASAIPTLTLFSESKYTSHKYTFMEYAGAYFKDCYNQEIPYKTAELFKLADRSEYDIVLGLWEDQNDYIDKFLKEAKPIINGRSKMTLNCTARIAATWNINDHYFLGAYGSYQYSNYVNKYDYTIKENNFSGQLFVGYRF